MYEYNKYSSLKLIVGAPYACLYHSNRGVCLRRVTTQVTYHTPQVTTQVT